MTHESIWVRAFGFLLLNALLPDVEKALDRMPVLAHRKHSIVLVFIVYCMSLIILLISFFVEILCPTFLYFLASLTYTIKMSTSYMYCVRVESLLLGPMRSDNVSRLLFLLKCFLALAYTINVLKAFIFYKSYIVVINEGTDEESSECKFDFGEGIWVILDEIMFTLADAFAFVLLIYIFSKHVKPDMVSPEIIFAREMFSRLLRIAAVPLISTIVCTIGTFRDPDNGGFIGTIDTQAHAIALFIGFASMNQIGVVRNQSAQVSPLRSPESKLRAGASQEGLS